MFILIACVVVLSATAIAVIRSKKPLKLILAEAKYELLYSAMGSKYMMHDILMRKKNITDLPLKSGKTAVITGGTRGIGLEVIKLLLKCDINVIIGCRNTQQGENLLPKFREEGISTGNIEVFQLDISVLESVKKFAELVKNKHDKIDYLINNAGILFGPYRESPDGFELQFATNYLGHFLLTHLLLPQLKRAGSEHRCSRIVNVSSLAHLFGDINFRDINLKKFYVPGKGYAQSKLAQILFSNYLNALLVREQENIRIYSVHPGVVDTEIFRSSWYGNRLPSFVRKLIFRNPVEAAVPVLYTCLSPDLENKGGTYIVNCKIHAASERAANVKLQGQFFEFSKNLAKIKTFSSLK